MSARPPRKTRSRYRSRNPPTPARSSRWPQWSFPISRHYLSHVDDLGLEQSSTSIVETTPTLYLEGWAIKVDSQTLYLVVTLDRRTKILSNSISCEYSFRQNFLLRKIITLISSREMVNYVTFAGEKLLSVVDNQVFIAASRTRYWVGT